MRSGWKSARFTSPWAGSRCSALMATTTRAIASGSRSMTRRYVPIASSGTPPWPPTPLHRGDRARNAWRTAYGRDPSRSGCRRRRRCAVGQTRLASAPRHVGSDFRILGDLPRDVLISHRVDPRPVTSCFAARLRASVNVIRTKGTDLPPIGPAQRDDPERHAADGEEQTWSRPSIIPMRSGAAHGSRDGYPR